MQLTNHSIEITTSQQNTNNGKKKKKKKTTMGTNTSTTTTNRNKQRGDCARFPLYVAATAVAAKGWDRLHASKVSATQRRQTNTVFQSKNRNHNDPQKADVTQLPHLVHTIMEYQEKRNEQKKYSLFDDDDD